MINSLNGKSKVPGVAYFSMEMGLEPGIPTYSGGLGVLAGDTLRSAADLGIPMVGISLVHRKGHFRQRLDEHGNQSESDHEWDPQERLELVEARTTVRIEGRDVRLCAWRYTVRGTNGHSVPVYLLDSALPENAHEHQGLTDQLYGGDARYRLCQEAVLGLGGVALLRALGHREIGTYHMNEGHSALLTLALLAEATEGEALSTALDTQRDAVRRQCVFTTHTPVPAGHDVFPLDLVRHVLGEPSVALLSAAGCLSNAHLNLTHLALYFAHFTNGVAMRHGQISQGMFPDSRIHSITNGVHVGTWTSPAFQRLFDRHIAGWRTQNMNLRYAVCIPLDEILEAHHEAKDRLLAEVARRTGVSLRRDAFTIGFARRATAYKRANLAFADIERLRAIVRAAGPIQFVFAGKAHRRDHEGKAMIRHVFEAASALRDTVPIVYLADYDMEIAETMVAGVDLWLNTPQKPLEASGTSGMKAALNGVPSLSVLDGWWLEGHVEGVTGWSIGESADPQVDPAQEVASLYDRLDKTILPMFYRRREEYARVMRSAISLNGSFFHTERMVLQYVTYAYSRGGAKDARLEEIRDGPERGRRS